MEKKTLEQLRTELKETCEKTNTRYSGMEFLVNYYIKQLGWSEEQAIEYALGLFKDGTITAIKLLNKDGEEI